MAMERSADLHNIFTAGLLGEAEAYVAQAVHERKFGDTVFQLTPQLRVQVGPQTLAFIQQALGSMGRVVKVGVRLNAAQRERIAAFARQHWHIADGYSDDSLLVRFSEENVEAQHRLILLLYADHMVLQRLDLGELTAEQSREVRTTLSALLTL